MDQFDKGALIVNLVDFAITYIYNVFYIYFYLHLP
jgi:hypothetical protein